MNPRSLLRPYFQCAATTAFLALAATALHAGTVIRGRQASTSGSPGAETAVSISDGNARMESLMNGKKTVMIFRGDKDLFWIVDEDAKTYREMTRADMAKMAGQLESAMKQLKAQMASMPPEQRAMVEKMMGKQLAAMEEQGGAPEVTYTKVGSGGAVGEWSTVKYEGKAGGEKVSEVWAAPSAKISPPDRKTMESMMDFFREIAGKFGGKELGALGADAGLDGVPVKVVSYQDGEPAGTYQVIAIEEKALPASEFDVPAGYAKQSFAIPGM